MGPLLELALKTGSAQALKRALPVLAEDLVGPIGWGLLGLQVIKAGVKQVEENSLAQIQEKLGCNHLELGKLDGPISTFREVVLRKGCSFAYHGAANIWHPQWDLDLRGLASNVYRYIPSTGYIGVYPSVHTFSCRICNPKS